ncbi:hypothetical protein NW768_007098 [Fusarium equiseti]|uniref:NACHT domain-containing protein n=1 Tax=Fusarium equiseti TaxID=61235 RepID=A0ABQ8RA13_FUSEQ|nr:hypothetical protein NW768_007098 [Fusarium equiseti]
MDSATDVTDAASRLAEFADEAIHFFQKLFSHEESAMKRVRQLDTLSKLAKEVHLRPSTNDHESQEEFEFSKQMLLHCSEIVRGILTEFHWNSDRGGLEALDMNGHGLLRLHDDLNGSRVNSLFEDLEREKMCLAAFRESEFKTLSRVPVVSPLRLEYSNSISEREKELLHYLFVTDPRQDLTSLELAKGNILEGTCSWITRQSEFRYWLLSPSKCQGLIIEGSEGTGKTMLVIYLAKQLERLYQHMPDNTVVYFFCNQGDICKSSATAVLRGLIWQLGKSKPELLRHALEKVEAHGSERVVMARGSFGTMWQIFVAMIRDPSAGNITCILDGIDECDASSVKALTDRFSDLFTMRTSPQNFKLLLTSLLLPLTMKFKDTFSSLRLNSELQEKITQDVELYIRTNVKRIAQDKSWPQELHNQVMETLDTRPNQSFHWARLVIFDLEYEPQGSVPLYLKFLTNSIDTIYHKTLQDCPFQHRNRIRLLLSWVLLTFNPLSFEELNILMGDQTSAPDTELENLKICIKLCRAFLVIKPEIRKSGLGYETVETVQLSQRSLKSFLTRATSSERFDAGITRIFPETDHEQIASRCLDLMEECLPTWSKGMADDKCNLVLPYATRFWFRHLRECPQKLQDDKIASRVMGFLMQGHVNRGLWFTYLSDLRDAQEHIKAPWTTIKYGHHFPTINGLGVITDIILCEEPKDFTSADKLNALQLGSLLGITPIVRKIIDTTSLLRYLRQTNIRSSLYGFFHTQSRNETRLIGTRRSCPLLSTAELVAMNPLELAVIEGHKDVVALLLERHPYSSLRPDSNFSLATAISRCDKDIVKLLIGAGAPKIRSPKDLEGPISTAITNNRLDVVRFLCRSDNDIWAQKDSKRDEVTHALLHLSNDATPYSYDESRFEQYATVLLQAGASPDGIASYQEGLGLRKWKNGVLQFLHTHGITLQALGPFPGGKTPLMLAISSMHLSWPDVDPKDILQPLLDSGASVNQIDRQGWTALHHVANEIALGRAKREWEEMDDGEEFKLYQVAGLLIAAGIDQDLKDKQGRRAVDILEVVGAPAWKRDVTKPETSRVGPTRRMSLE